MFQVRALQCQGILSFHSPELHFGGQRLVGDPAVWILIRERHGNSTCSTWWNWGPGTATSSRGRPPGPSFFAELAHFGQRNHTQLTKTYQMARFEENHDMTFTSCQAALALVGPPPAVPLPGICAVRIWAKPGRSSHLRSKKSADSSTAMIASWLHDMLHDMRWGNMGKG